jgi:hypothetical protein
MNSPVKVLGSPLGLYVKQSSTYDARESSSVAESSRIQSLSLGILILMRAFNKTQFQLDVIGYVRKNYGLV